MKYDDAIEWLYGTQLFGIKLGLENISRMLEFSGVLDALGGKKIVHVAGTNGKGSVCAFTEKILRDAGFRTGLFTSPHLISFRERIRINGNEVEEVDVAEGLSLIRREVKEWEQHPTFFEITLALAMRVFCNADCEIIILETGMGGRLDATNSLKANVSVITPIALDHQEWLGDTLEKISAEKAGIIKRGVPVIVSSVNDVIQKRALEIGAPHSVAGPLPAGWTPSLPGSHQRQNAALAVATVKQLHAGIGDDVIRQAIATTEWPGRFQIIRNSVVLDGAHNEAAAKKLVATWHEVFGYEEKANLIFGVADSKDTVGILAQMRTIAVQIALVPIKSDRQISSAAMKMALAEAGGADTRVVEFDTLAEAIDSFSREKEKTLIAGSLFLVGEALDLLQKSGNSFEVSSQ